MTTPIVPSTEVAAFATAITEAEARLSTALTALRTAAKAVNDLGALANAMQGAAQDVEYVASPPLRAFLDGSYIQRAAYVSEYAGKTAELLRQLSRGVGDLKTDGEKAIAIVESTN